MSLTPEVAEGIDEIRATFADSAVSTREDGEGGGFVIVDPVNPGAQYLQGETWIGFRITFQYPHADVYPHFVRGDLTRADLAALGEGMSSTTFEERSAIQISRRSQRIEPTTNSAVIKLLKVLEWLRSR